MITVAKGKYLWRVQNDYSCQGVNSSGGYRMITVAKRKYL